MKKIILGLSIGLASVTSWSACTYNFDAMQAQLDQWALIDYKLMPNINGQNLSGTLRNTVTKTNFIGTSSAYAQFRMQHPNMPPNNVVIIDKLVPLNGVFATEVVLDALSIKDINLNTSAGFEKPFGIALKGFSDSKFELDIFFDFVKRKSSNQLAEGTYIDILGATTQVDATGNLGFKTYHQESKKINIPTDGKVKIGIYLNQNTRQLGYIINGVNYGYSNLIIDKKIKSISFEGGINNVTSLSPFLNKSISMQFLTDKNSLSSGYPAGTTDICGTAL